MKAKLLSVLFAILIFASFAYASLTAININSPADNTYTSATRVNITFTLTGRSLNGTLVELNSTNYTISLAPNASNQIDGQCVGDPVATNVYNYTCTQNVTTLVSAIHSYRIYMNDSDGNVMISDSRTVTVDLDSAPRINLSRNFTYSNSDATWTALVSDIAPVTCKALVWNSTYSNTINFTGSFDATTLKANCSVTIEPDQFTNDGSHVVQMYVADGLGNINTSNYSTLRHTLPVGWNLLTYPETNRTGGGYQAHEICSRLQYCTGISFRNNTAGTFVTYSTSTPSVNNDTRFTAGTPILVYVSATDYILSKDEMPTTGTQTLYNASWNTLGTIQRANLSAIMNIANNTGYYGVTFASKQQNSSSFITCRKSLSLCTGGASSVNPRDVIIPKGTAAWVLVNSTSPTLILNLTNITG